jgi:uncharacterized membrane protein YeaQ/YmgE (transglycosylase-associated protein family)
MGVLLFIAFGLIVGVIAKLVIPGKQPGGIIATTLCGVAGALLGGWVGRLLGFHTSRNQLGGWILAIVGAIVVVLAYQAVVRRRTIAA